MVVAGNIILLLGFFLFLVFVLYRADRRIEEITSITLKRLFKFILYAFMFTPTIYHHDPNTIVAPFHLATMTGIMFYDDTYTLTMFIWGEVLPFLMTTTGIYSYLTIKKSRRSKLSSVKA